MFDETLAIIDVLTEPTISDGDLLAAFFEVAKAEGHGGWTADDDWPFDCTGSDVRAELETISNWSPTTASMPWRTAMKHLSWKFEGECLRF
ncbi:MAG: hypothetical protein ACPGVG_08735 [Mycobacterium sp.]